MCEACVLATFYFLRNSSSNSTAKCKIKKLSLFSIPLLHHPYFDGHYVRLQNRSNTLSILATSGLNFGVLIYWRNNVQILFLSPSKLHSFTSLDIRSTSLSINSTISCVNLHSCSWKKTQRKRKTNSTTIRKQTNKIILTHIKANYGFYANHHSHLSVCSPKNMFIEEPLSVLGKQPPRKLM